MFFVTIVTAGRVPWFGCLGGGRVALTEAGQIVEDEWRRTGDLRPNVSLDAFVVMPDHVHGILWIDGGDALHVTDGIETPRRGVSTGRGASCDPWRPGVLGAVINHLKGACTRRIRATHPDFAWQSRFYDVVIRDSRHWVNARRYIAENPARHAASRC